MLFFFSSRRRHTRCGRDWSSDVCSSDLGGCLAPHSHLRGVIRPTPRQQGLDGEEAPTGTPYWPWARLLGRVFGLEMRTCPFCRRGTLRLIAVITQESVITRILRHLQLASVPPPMAPARARQERFTFA